LTHILALLIYAHGIGGLQLIGSQKGDRGVCMVSERGTPLNGVITTQRWLEVLVAPRKSLADCPHKKWVNGSKWAVAKSEWCSKCGCRFCPFAYTVKNGRAQRDILQIICE